MKYKLYLVGGIIRDRLLGLKSKDIDYSVVVENREDYNIDTVLDEFAKQLETEGYKVYKKSPKTFTVKAKFPEDHKNFGQDADFVLARKELGYIKGTRTPEVVLGSLRDDLIRRDFTVNALAEDLEGNIIDLFNGQKDLLDRVLRTPTDAVVSFNNDPLRILRAMRFAITKNMGWSDEMWRSVDSFDASKFSVVSVERTREELFKCFKFDTKGTLDYLRVIYLNNYPLYEAILPDEMWLNPSLGK